MAKSIQLDTSIANPGIFWSDNPYAWPPQPLDSLSDDLSNAPFHCHIARGAKKELEDAFTAGHIIYGQQRGVNLGTGKSGSANKFDRITGFGKLFTAKQGPPRKKSHHDLQGSNGDQYGAPCPILFTNNQIPHPTGVFLGRKTPDELYLEKSGDIDSQVNAFWASKARWSSPLGVQFRWSSRGSKDACGAINMTNISLIYLDSWMPGRTLYMPLIIPTEEYGANHEMGKFVNERSYWRGSDPLTKNYGSGPSGPNSSQYFGEVVAYAEPEVLDYMADPFTRAVCVGMYIEFHQPQGQNAVYDMVREFFDFKFLYDMPDKNGNFAAMNSRYIYPAPYPLSEALYGKSVKLT